MASFGFMKNVDAGVDRKQKIKQNKNSSASPRGRPSTFQGFSLETNVIVIKKKCKEKNNPRP